jgi:hypothetical protein
MRQIFFISPKGYMPVRKAFTPHVPGARTHGWSAEGDDPKSQTVIGVVEMDGSCDAESVLERLEREGILWLPNHHQSAPISQGHLSHLEKHGVVPGDSTTQAMTKVHAKAGFPPLKPKRF